MAEMMIRQMNFVLEWTKRPNVIQGSALVALAGQHNTAAARPKGPVDKSHKTLFRPNRRSHGGLTGRSPSGEHQMRAGLLPISAINLNHPGRYVHWGVIQISVANLVLILVMIAIFAAAILLPFPGNRRRK